MIYITERAVDKVREIAQSEGIDHHNIRVSVKGGGCAGWMYDMIFEDNISEIDEVIEVKDIKMVFDPLSFQYMDEMTVDFIDGPMSAGFNFLNPNATGSCGCGSSHSF